MNNKDISKVIVSTLTTVMVINPIMVNANGIVDVVKENKGIIDEIDDIVEDNSSSIQEGVDITSEGLNAPIIKQGDTIRASKNSIYLSDLEYDDGLSYTRWKDIMKDTNTDGVKIRLKVDGEVTTFEKGMGAHATSELVYDVGDYTDEYTHLSVYLGVDYGQLNKGNGVSFIIYTSDNCKDWVPVHITGVMLPENNAEYVKVDISNAKYIKLYAYDNGRNNNDHSVYGDLRLLKAGYDIESEKIDCIKKVSEYDDEIKSLYTIGDELSDELKRLILERTFVHRYGYTNLQQYASLSSDNREAIEWIFADDDALELFIQAGTLNGDGAKTIEAFCRLYTNHKSDLSPVNLKSNIYKKMMIATAVAYCRNLTSYITTYGGYSEPSDAVFKYEIYKEFYDTGKFLRRDEFDTYNMELVRYVLDSRMDDDEIRWLRYYSEDRYPSDTNRRLNPYSFISYVQPNYGKDEYYSEDYRQKWEDKYKLAEYGVTNYGQRNRARLWMEMEHGGICWNISGLGINLNEVHGLPSVNVFQPGHEAYLTYTEDNQGIGTWSIGNNVSGWASSYTNWGGMEVSKARLLLGWGNQYYNRDTKNNASYILLAQAALNDYDNYLDANYYSLLAESYIGNPSAKIDIYNKALEKQSFNLDALHGLIKAYEELGTKTSQEWLDLAKMIIEEYTYYPLPMVELITLIQGNVTESIHIAELDILKTSALNKASVATANESIQAAACKEVAKSLLGVEAVNLASFSFDGENAGSIVINEKYDQYGIRVRYSVDGGLSYKQTEEHVIPLTEDELARINATDDIIVGLIGTEETFRIDIQAGKALANDIYLNDKENLLIGGNLDNLEYSIDGGTNWQDYDNNGVHSTSVIEGTVSAKFRYKSYGTYLTGPERVYNFTENTDKDTKKYIPLKHINLYKFSSEQSKTDKAAKNMLDGNYNTRWHTSWDIEDTEKYISVEFDKVRHINTIEYVPYDASGRLRSGNVYTSMDGETWDLVYSFEDLPNTTSSKYLILGESIPTKYIKIESTESWWLHAGQQDLYFGGRMLNFYEDTTQTYVPSVTVEYSETNPTNDNVTATLKLPSGCVAIDGDEFVFETNGKHIFKYIDANGEERSIEAIVSNIDKKAPVGVVSYNITELTNGSVVATLECDEDVTIISEGVVDNTYTFEDNAIYTFEFMDEAGNIGTVEAKVDWIYKNKPTEMLIYSASKEENDKPLVVDLNINLEEVEILNEDGASSVTFTKNGEHIFKLRLKDTGYEFEVKVVVDWLDEEAIEESLKEENNDSVGSGDTDEDATVGDEDTDEDATVGDEDTDEDTTIGDEDTTIGDEDTTIGDEDTDEDTTIGDEDTTVGDEDTTDEDATVGDEDTTDEDTTIGGGDSGNDGSAEDTTVGSESTNNGGTTDIEEDNDTDADKPLNDTNNGNNDNSSGNSQSSGNNGNVNNNSNNGSGNNSNNSNVTGNSEVSNNSDVTGNSEVSNNSDSSSNTVVNNSSSDIKVDISTDNEVSNNKVTTEPTESTDNTIVINSSDDNIEVNKSEQLDGALDTDNSYGENNFFIVISSVGGSLLGILAWLRKRFL